MCVGLGGKRVATRTNFGRKGYSLYSSEAQRRFWRKESFLVGCLGKQDGAVEGALTRCPLGTWAGWSQASHLPLGLRFLICEMRGLEEMVCGSLPPGADITRSREYVCVGGG